MTRRLSGMLHESAGRQATCGVTAILLARRMIRQAVRSVCGASDSVKRIGHRHAVVVLAVIQILAE